MSIDFLKKMIVLLFIYVVFSCCTYGFCQDPYKISFVKDVPLILGSLGGEIVGGYIIKGIRPFDQEDLDALNPMDINGFDRRAINNFSSMAANASDVFLITALSYPAFLMFDKPIRQDFLKISLMTAEVIFINGAVTTVTKGLVKRPRPFAYNNDLSLEERNGRNVQLSFFSGHTSSVAALSFFTAKVFSDYHPDSKWKPVIWSTAALLPAVTGLLRYQGGKHFPTDIITGYAVGGLIGILIPRMHINKNAERKVELSLLTNSDQLGILLRW